jgi:hypothetical protein
MIDIKLKPEIQVTAENKMIRFSEISKELNGLYKELEGLTYMSQIPSVFGIPVDNSIQLIQLKEKINKYLAEMISILEYVKDSYRQMLSDVIDDLKKGMM